MSTWRYALTGFVSLCSLACAPHDPNVATKVADAAADGESGAAGPDPSGGAPDGWMGATAPRATMATALLDDLDAKIAAGTYRPDALVVAKDGRLVHERYWNGFTRDTPHDLRSATKTFTSALVGAAIDRGMLSENATVTSFFANGAPIANPDPRKDAITIRHLLDMQGGLACDDWVPDSPGNEENMYGTHDWVRFTLDLPMAHAPGQSTRYCTGGVVALGAVVARATKRSVPEFAREALFDKLDVIGPQWALAPNGDADTGGHLRLRPRDFAKLGQLFLDRGTWRGRRVLSESWVTSSMTARTSLGDSRYGSLWWINTFNVAGTPVDVIFARGNGGQYVFVAPAYRLVAAFTGSDYDGKGSQDPVEMFGKYVLRAAMN